MPAHRTTGTSIMRNVFEKTSFDFMGRERLAVAITIGMILLSLVAIFGRGLNLGVDFTGGYTLELGYEQAVDLNEVRSRLESAHIDGAQVQNFGSSTDVLLRIAPEAGATSASLSTEVLGALKSTSDQPITVRRVEFVGPQVGEELREKGGMAILVALAAIVVYIWFRYEKKFALGAVLATVHDVIVTVGFFALFQIEFDLTVLAAILAIIGYSLNDTIVVFDRIRENFRTTRNGTPQAIMNDAINQTLSRTIITSGTTVMVVISLLLLGGQVIHGFALAMLIGIVYGTYSSIFVASMIVKGMGITKADLMPVEQEGADLEQGIQP